MTLQRKEQIKCPECGNIQMVTVWSSINVSLDPMLKDELFKATINVFDCEGCDLKMLLPVPLLYHDMDLKYSIQFIPFERTLDPEFLKDFGSDGALSLSKGRHEIADTYLVKPHIVFDMHELVLYILFRERLAQYHNHNA